MSNLLTLVLPCRSRRRTAGSMAFACFICGNVAAAQDAKRFGPTPSPPGSKIYFVDVKDGMTIPTKTTMHFGLKGMGVAPAGLNRPNSGHHHLLIDTELPPLDESIPSDFNHLHFGAGQTEADVTLTPGRHTLQLLFADSNHIPHNPPLASERITVNVSDAGAAEGVAATQPKPVPRTPSPPGAKVYFVDVKDGATISTHPTLHFGLRAMGVAPAGLDRPNSGHHHLIVDAELPPLDMPIPVDVHHLHFGAGQTEADITLTPGKHTLQLLFADKAHVPHNPPVLSAKITVTVADAGPPQTAAEPQPPRVPRNPSPPGAKVYIVYPLNGSVVPPKLTVRFGLVGMGVAPAGFEKANTGHHHLLIDSDLPPFDEPIPSDFNHLHFGSGQTEGPVTLPLGRHKLQLLFSDANHVAHNPPVYSQPVTVYVTATGKVPQAVRRYPYNPRYYYRAPPHHQ